MHVSAHECVHVQVYVTACMYVSACTHVGCGCMYAHMSKMACVHVCVPAHAQHELTFRVSSSSSSGAGGKGGRSPRCGDRGSYIPLHWPRCRQLPEVLPLLTLMCSA